MDNVFIIVVINYIMIDNGKKGSIGCVYIIYNR